MAEKETYYEMLWDCTQCETKGLLGDSHRHCPTCGAAQDPAKRYFPKPGEEIEAKNHQFVGADWSCAYCSTPNSNAAAHCTNCGAGKDGTKPVATVVDTVAVPPPAPVVAAAKSGSSSWMRWVFGLAALALITIIALFSITKETTATVSQRTWLREIQIEKLAPVSESAWCDSLPSEAYSVTQSREQRSTKKIPDGQDCHEERVDKGDGTFVKRKECTPRYREEPVYDNRCHFQVNRWRTTRAVKAGPETSLAPVWPSVGNLSRGTTNVATMNLGNLMGNKALLGAEREGPRRESYGLTLASGSKSWTCAVSETVWNKYEQGSTTPLKVRMTGGADCDSLK